MFETIVLAADASGSSRRAAAIATDLAHRYHSEVVVAHVREFDAVLGGLEFESMEEANSLVDGIVRTIKDEGISARGELHEAPHAAVGDEIVDLAHVAGAGLIVMGSHGLGLVRSLVHGSVTHQVLHRAECPVLVVR